MCTKICEEPNAFKSLPQRYALINIFNGFGILSSRGCTGQKRKVMSLSYNSMEGQTLLTEWPLGVGLMLSFCRKEVLVWSSLFDGDSPMPLKGRTNPLIFVDLLNIQKVVLNIKYLRLYILSTNISTKEREWWKEKSSMFMSMFLFCPVKCCVETFVENLLMG